MRLVDTGDPLVIERTNQDWLRLLGRSGAEANAAVGDLRKVIRRGLRRSLDGRAGADDALLEDLTQDAVVKVLEGLPSFRGESRFTTWAITIAVRVAFTKLRRARWKDVSLERLAEDAPRWSPPASQANAEDRAAKDAALAIMSRVLETELTDRQRQVLVAELRGMPHAEIAAQLGISPNALYKLRHDARQKLKRGLEAAGVTEDEVRETFGV